MITLQQGLVFLVTAGLAPALLTAVAQTGSCEQSRLPAVLPFDALIFQAEVIEPAVESQEGPTAAVRVQVTDAALLPRSKTHFDLVLLELDANCTSRPLERQELIDRFATTERIRVVAREGGMASDRLQVYSSWVSSGEAVRTQAVQDTYDYFGALLRLERAASDGERIPPLRSIAEYVEDPALFRRIVEHQLESKRLRKQVIAMHRALQRPPP